MAYEVYALTLLAIMGSLLMLIVRRARVNSHRARASNAALEHSRSALAESEARMRGIVEAAVDAIITIDERGAIETFNRAAEQLLGYSSAEVTGKNVTVLMPAQYRADHGRHIGQYIQTGQAQIIGIGREVVAQRKDGAIIPVHLSVSETFVGQRRIFTGIMHDITQRKQQEAAIRQAKEAAESANRAKDHFLAVLSHELRTPLTPAVMAASILERDASLPAETRQMMEMIHRNVDLAARLIDDLLDLTRISRGKLKLLMQDVDVHVLVGRVLEMLAADLTAKQLTLDSELKASATLVHGDPARLQQAFWNLVKNAIKFTPAGGRITVRSHDAAAGERIIIEVADTGIGIDPQVLPRIFDAFEQGEADITRQFGGLGLGLAISKALLAMHGATVTATSEGKGKGATFTVKLPVASCQLPAGAPEPSLATGNLQPATGNSQLATRGLRILLLEDHDDTRRILSRLLSSMGHQVKSAESLRSALAAAEKSEFDLVLSDLCLPDGSGMELMQRLHEHSAVPGIALSGLGMESDIQRSREAGFAQHLIKPIAIEELQHAIEGACVAQASRL